MKRRKKKKSKSPSKFQLRFQYIPKLDGHRRELYFKYYKKKEDHEKAKTELDRLLDDGFTRLQVYRFFRDSKRRKKKESREEKKVRISHLLLFRSQHQRIALHIQVKPAVTREEIRGFFDESVDKENISNEEFAYEKGEKGTSKGLSFVFGFFQNSCIRPDDHEKAFAKLVRLNGSVIAMRATIRGSTQRFKDDWRIAHGACPSDPSDSTEKTEKSCVVVFGIKTDSAEKAVRMVHEIVNMTELKKEIQHVTDTVKEKWLKFDTMKNFVTDRLGYFPISVSIDENSPKLVFLHFGRHFPHSHYIKGLNTMLPEGESIQKFSDLTNKHKVYTPELYKLILESYRRSVRIHFYSSNGKMSMHVDGSGADANEYVKLSLSFSDVGF